METRLGNGAEELTSRTKRGSSLRIKVMQNSRLSSKAKWIFYSAGPGAVSTRDAGWIDKFSIMHTWVWGGCSKSSKVIEG